MTVEPSVLLEKEIADDPNFVAVKDSFRTWDDEDKGAYMLMKWIMFLCVKGTGFLASCGTCATSQPPDLAGCPPLCVNKHVVSALVVILVYW